MERAVA